LLNFNIIEIIIIFDFINFNSKATIFIALLRLIILKH